MFAHWGKNNGDYIEGENMGISVNNSEYIYEYIIRHGIFYENFVRCANISANYGNIWESS